ncbi:hypothetical protein E4U54_002611 [Claviceps lovelessii]|nr:hypothetical protein E4U54_002611 [Claviceps lovelessii]
MGHEAGRVTSRVEVLEHPFDKILSLRRHQLQTDIDVSRLRNYSLATPYRAASASIPPTKLLLAGQGRKPLRRTPLASPFVSNRKISHLHVWPFHAATGLTRPGALEKAQEKVTGMPEATFPQET